MIPLRGALGPHVASDLAILSRQLRGSPVRAHLAVMGSSFEVL